MSNGKRTVEVALESTGISMGLRLQVKHSQMDIRKSIVESDYREKCLMSLFSDALIRSRGTGLCDGPR